MATTAHSSQYHREERRAFGQTTHSSHKSTRQANWDDHLDGLLTDLKESLPPGDGSTPSNPVTSLSLPASADLSVSAELPGSEDFHERHEFTSPDRRTHTVEERSRRTERLNDGASQVVSRKVVRSESSSRTTERCTVSPEPIVSPTDRVDSGSANGFMDRSQRIVNHNMSATQDCKSPVSPPSLPAMEVPSITPAPGTQSHVTQYEYRTSQRSVSPAVPRRPPSSPPSPLPTPGPAQRDASTVTAAPPAGTTINYHIYNYGAETTVDSGTLERAGERRWQSDSLERTASSGRPASPGERLYSRSVTTQVERTTTGADTEGSMNRQHQVDGRGGPGAFPVDTVDTVDRSVHSGQTTVHVPSDPQDGTYPNGPRRRDLGSGQVSEVKTLQVVTEASESNSDGCHTPLSQSQTQTTPGVYYPPSDRLDCETKFHSKEKSKEGNKKTYFESSGKYKASGGSKQKESKGGKTIPICLPCCAGAACAIM